MVPRPVGIGRVVGYRVPPTGQSLPGAIVGPHAEVQLVIGVRATKPGRHGFTSLDVLYHVGAASYVEPVPLGLALCAPFTVKNCPLPPEPSFDG